MYYIISLIFGIMPDILYYFFYLKQIKEIKKRKIPFFLLLCLVYFLCIVLIPNQLYLYLILDISIYFIMKLLYKSKINDFFLIMTLDLYVVVCSIITFFIFKNYFIAFVVYRVLLFIPLIFTNKLRKIYCEYTRLWNRHSEKSKIKSITIRNIVLFLLNLMIVLFYVVLSYMSKII